MAKNREQDAEPVEGTSPMPGPAPSLHQMIIGAFVRRLEEDEHVGADVASVIAATLRGPKLPKRDAIIETIRIALATKKETDGAST